MANTTMVSFKRGADLNNLAITDGQFIVNTAERSIYVDVGTERLRIGDFVSVANTEALPTAGANETALYYVEDINCLAKWNGTGWTQINRDSGAVNFTVTGDGNAITDVAYDAKTRTLTLTKGVTFTTPAVVDSKISDKVGTLKIGENTYDTVVAYVNKKAEDTLAAAQGGSSETAASVKQALDNYKDENDAKVQANADAIKAIQDDYLKSSDKEALQASIDEKADQTDLTALSDKIGTIADGSTVAGLITTAQAQADKGVADAAAAQSAADAAQDNVDALAGKIGTVTEGKTVVEMIAEAQAAATYDDSALSGRVTTIENDYLKNADKTALEGSITAEADRAKAAEKTNADAIAAVKSDVDTFLAAAEIGGEAIDTLKEIQDYITTDGAAADQMVKDIAANKKAIEDEATTARAAEQANSDAIAALDTVIGKAAEGENPATGLIKDIADNASAIADEQDRAEGAESALSDRIDTLEAIDHSVYALKTDVATDKQTLQGNIDAVSERVTDLEDKNISDGANKVEASTTNGNIKIDGVETVVYTHPAEHAISEVTGLQGALDAKATVAALNATNGNVQANANAITALQTGKADKATTLAGYGITDAYTKTETYNQDEINALLTWGEF